MRVGHKQILLSAWFLSAVAVKTYLISKGIDTNDINTAVMGEGQPFANNATAKGRAENRRVEIVVSSTRTTQ